MASYRKYYVKRYFNKANITCIKNRLVYIF